MFTFNVTAMDCSTVELKHCWYCKRGQFKMFSRQNYVVFGGEMEISDTHLFDSYLCKKMATDGREK